jgi:hypothetical protein
MSKHHHDSHPKDVSSVHRTQSAALADHEAASLEFLEPSAAPPLKLLALQRTIGNQATMRLISRDQDTSSASQLIQRDLMSYADWKNTSAISDSGKKIRGARSLKLKKIDKALKQFHKQRGFPEHEFGFAALTRLQDAITTYLTEKADTERRSSINTLRVQVLAEVPLVTEMRQIRDRLLNSYGITLDNPAGVASIYAFYRSQGASKKVLKQLQTRPWKLDELRLIETALSHYSPLLGANRPAALGGQTITTFSRLEADIEQDMSSIEGTVNPVSTFAETFTQRVNGNTLSNISVFENARNVLDFAGDPHNPTQDELAKGYRGTIIHELSHGLIEMLPAPNGAAAFPDGTAVSNMIEHFANEMTFWTGLFAPSGTAGAEKPITDYGETSAKEDMAEAIMYFIEDPGKLQRDCPKRYRFVIDKLSNYLNPASIQAAQQKATRENPQLNPPPLPPVPAAAGAAATAGAGAAAPIGGAISAAALQAGAAALRPVVPNAPPAPPVPAAAGGGGGGAVTPEALQAGAAALQPVPAAQPQAGNDGGEEVAQAVDTIVANPPAASLQEVGDEAADEADEADEAEAEDAAAVPEETGA